MSTISSVNAGTAQAFGAAGTQQAHHHHRHGGGKEVASALQSIGVDSSKASDIQQQIDDAIKSARQNGDSSTDPRSAVKNAIDGVLKKNGIDPAKFESAMQAQFKSRHQGASPTGATPAPIDPDGDAQAPTTLTSNGSLNTTA